MAPKPTRAPVVVALAPPPPPPSPAPYVLHCARPGGCHYVLNDGRPWRFCAEPVLPGRRYCARHEAVCHHHGKLAA